MAEETARIYTPSSAEEIRDDFLTDFRLEARKYADDDDVDRACLPGSDVHILATAMGNLGLLQYSNISTNDTNADVLLASGKKLDEKREALGLPEVPASPSTGILTVTLPVSAVANFNNTEFTLPNGKRGKVDGVQSVVGSTLQKADVNVVTIDTGADTELAAGEKVKFASPPVNVSIEATVSASGPLQGGRDEEDDEHKRDRILNRLQTVPAGGNWGYLIEKALNASASLQCAFVYPALGGPASVKVTLVKDIDPAIYDFTRTVPDAGIAIIRAALHAVIPDEIELVVGTATGENTDVAITAVLPASASAGGNGQGWVDETPWPALTGGETYVPITAAASGSVFTIDANTAISPALKTIAWWSSVDQAFKTAYVTSATGGASAWVVTLDKALADHNGAKPTVGDYISPAAVNIEKYGKTWQTSLRNVGPGENTAAATRLPRALRHPFIADAWFSSLTVRQLLELLGSYDEITDITWSYRSVTTPTVPAAVSTNPNILTLRHFGIYKQ